MFGFSVLIGLTLAVTSEFVTLFIVIIFHREFFEIISQYMPNLTCKQYRDI